MKQLFICLFFLLAFASRLSAQSETTAADTLRSDEAPVLDLLPSTVKNYDGFLLDMGLMGVMPPRLPRFTLEVPNASKDYSYLFRLNPDATYSQGIVSLFAPSFGSGFYGLGGLWGGVDNLQMGSFRLKNGWQLNTYGEYNKDGWRVPNPSALPWERNNFKGAFELKSSNGAFGIRIEVQQGRRY